MSETVPIKKMCKVFCHQFGGSELQFTSVDLLDTVTGHQLQDISEAASLFRRVRIGDQPNSDWASSAWWRRPKRQPGFEPCFPAQARTFGFIWKQINRYYNTWYTFQCIKHDPIEGSSKLFQFISDSHIEDYTVEIIINASCQNQ